MNETAIAPENNSLPVRYSPTEAAIAEMKARYSVALDTRKPEDYELARVGIGECVKARSAIEKCRVAGKSEALAYGRRVDSEAKRLTALITEIEEPLRKAKAVVDDEAKRKAEEAAAKVKAEQEAAEKAKRDAEEARLKAIRDEEAAKIKADREKLAEEQKRVAAEQAAERAKLDAERKAAAAEQAKRDAEAKAERDKLAAERKAIEDAQRAEQAKIDAERKAVQSEKERLDRIEFERVAKEKAAKEAAEQAEANRIAAEQRKQIAAKAAEDEKKRIEAERPDIEQIHAYGAALRGVVPFAVKSVKANEFLDRAVADTLAIAERCETLKTLRGIK